MDPITNIKLIESRLGENGSRKSKRKSKAIQDAKQVAKDNIVQTDEGLSVTEHNPQLGHYIDIVV